MTAAGVALYALAGSCKCPEYLMASEFELAAQGIAGTADVLPVPVGPEPQAPMSLRAARVRLAQYGERTKAWSTATYNDGTEKALHEIAVTLLAEVNRLEAERHSTNESLDEAAQALRVDRDRIADLERVIAEAPASYALMERARVEADGITRRFAPSQALREDEPAEAGACTECGDGPNKWCVGCAKCSCESLHDKGCMYATGGAS